MKYVSSEEELQKIEPDETTKLTDDIYLNKDFTPFDTFSGTLYGNGYTIYNLTPCFIETITPKGTLQNVNFSMVSIDIVNDNDQGGIISENRGVVKSVTVKEATVVGEEFSGGILVGKNTSGCIKDCTVLSATSDKSYYIGGIAGITHRGEISNCSVFNSTFDAGRSGGICPVSRDSTVINCQVYDSVIQGDSVVGGIVGTSKEASVTDSSVLYSLVRAGTKSYGARSGGVIGYSIDSMVENVQVVNTLIKGVDMSGGITGQSDAPTLLNNTVKNCSIEGVTPETSVDIVFGSTNTEKEVTSLNVENSTIVGKDVCITDTELLRDSDVDVCVKYMDSVSVKNSSKYNISTSKLRSSTIEVSKESDLKEVGYIDTVLLQNDISISDSAKLPFFFYGTLEGNGNTISGLQAELFEFLYGKVRNLTLKNIEELSGYSLLKGCVACVNYGQISDVCIKDTELRNVKTDLFGVICGENGGDIFDSTVEITVENCGKVSGVVGSLSEDASVKNCNVQINGVDNNMISGIADTAYSGVIRNCTVDGEVKAKDRAVGITGKTESYGGSATSIIDNVSRLTAESNICSGIIGVVDSNTILKRNFFCGKLQADLSGGIVARTESKCTIENCRSEGIIEGSSIVGGLVGENDSETTILRSYSAGKLKCDTICGGLVGKLKKGKIKECYSIGTIHSVEEPIDPVIGESDVANPCESTYWTPKQENIQYSLEFGVRTDLSKSEVRTLLTI